MRKFFEPADAPLWFRQVLDSIRQALGDVWDVPLRLWRVATANLPTASTDNEGGILYDETTSRITYSDGSSWLGLQPYDAAVASLAALSIVQGDLLYGSAADTLSRLAKDTNATRYLANTGTSNNPAWAQVNLTNGVTGDLPFANLAQGSALSVLGVTGNATADFASIAAGTDGHVLRRSGTSLAFGTIATAGIGDDQVTYAKIQNVSATDKLLGRSTSGAGDVEEIACTAAGRALLDDADASAQRTTLGLGTIATQNANAVAITGGTVAGITSLGVSGNITATGNVHTFGPSSSTPGSGANLRLHNDAGTYQWLIGLLGSVGATEFNIGNGVTSTVLYSIDTTGNLKSQGSIVLTSTRHPQLRSYTVASLPSAATAAQLIYVSNETGGAVVAFSDGTNWRRVTDRAIVA